jgi:hypothetical protein
MGIGLERHPECHTCTVLRVVSELGIALLFVVSVVAVFANYTGKTLW